MQFGSEEVLNVENFSKFTRSLYTGKMKNEVSETLHMEITLDEYIQEIFTDEDKNKIIKFLNELRNSYSKIAPKELANNSKKTDAKIDKKESIAQKTMDEKLTYEEFWITDIKKAKKIARTEKKYMLLNFTGSDWCGWCVKLEKDVFDKSEFKKYAQNKLVMVKLDYPKKSKQSSKIKRQNKELKEKYKIAGYPNILLITRHGKAIGQIKGYRKGGVKNYIEHIESIINN